jgi:signal transduction histidine kinase
VSERVASEAGSGLHAESSGEAVPVPAGRSGWSLPSRSRHSLSARLAGIYLLATIPLLLGLSVAIYFLTAFYIDQRLDADLAAQADFHAAYVASLVSDERALTGLAPKIVGMFAPQADVTVRFFAASDGTLLAASQDIGLQPSLAALRGLRYRSPTVFVRASRDLPDRHYVARTIVVAGQSIGVVEVSRSTLAAGRFLTTLRYIMLGTILGAGVVSLLISLVLARRLSRPIRDMQHATERIATGDFESRLDRYPPDELGRLAEGVNHMAEQLKDLESARGRFISEISHDLRTPLTSIKGMLANLADDPEVGGGRSLSIAEHETDRLIRLVNQLLDFSRWQHGHLELNRCPTDIIAVACDAVAFTEERARHRGVRLEVDLLPNPLLVSADRDRLERVILNLLENAIKFTPTGGLVTLSVTHVNGEVRVSVRDTGLGMSDEERSRAFEVYYRGKGSGTGLGLAIVQAIVEAHGGRIGVDSGVGQGSNVWFTLPL